MNISFGKKAITGFLLGALLFAAVAQSNGASPLLTAAENGDIATVKTLLAKGNRPNVKDKYGRTPLFVAALKGHKEVVEVLLANKADVNAKNMYGYTALHATDFKDVAELLVANNADVNAKDRNGTTPLHSAAIGGRKEIVELLLAHGADANAKDKNSAIPLCVARSRNKELVDALLTKSKSLWPSYVSLIQSTSIGATNLPTGTKLKLVDVQSQEIKVALGEGVKAIPTKVTDLVEQVHRNCLAVEAEHSQDPTLRAAAQTQLAMAEAQRALDGAVAKARRDAGSALIKAAAAGDVINVKRALGLGVDVNATNADGATPLLAAVMNGHKRVVEILLASNADVNATTKQGYTPLFLASVDGNKEIVEILLAHKADPELREKEHGWTPLFEAASSGHKEVVEVLLANKADVNAKDSESGWTPLHAAAFKGHKEVVEVLLANKADVNAKDKDGGTPLHAALAGKHKDIADLIRNSPTKPAGTQAKEMVESPSQDTVIQQFTGSGGRNTRPFIVTDGWEIQWDASGDIFQVYLYRGDGELVGVAANQQQAGRGSSYQPKGGQYYLQVNSVGDWTIRVVQTKTEVSK